MYRTIAVPLDTSSFAETALAPAVELARAEDATLVLMSVSDLEETEAYVRRAAAELDDDLTIAPGIEDHEEPADAIARLAGTPDTLVCMATHGRSWPTQLMFGSVATEVLRRVGEPLLLVGPRYLAQAPIVGGDLVLPLDGSELAEQAIPSALAFGKAFGMRIWVVAVLDPASPGPAGSSDTMEAAMVERAAQDLWHQHDRVEWEVLHGHPAAAIADFAGRVPASLIAMTTHGRTGLRKVAGSVATRLVHFAPCPVLLHRPG